MGFLSIRAVYIGPIEFFNGALHAHFTTAREAAAREGNGIEICCDRAGLRERLRQLKENSEVHNGRG